MKVNLYDPKQNKVIDSGFFSSFDQAREYFNHKHTGFFYLVDDAYGMEKSKKCYLK